MSSILLLWTCAWKSSTTKIAIARSPRTSSNRPKRLHEELIRHCFPRARRMVVGFRAVRRKCARCAHSTDPFLSIGRAGRAVHILRAYKMVYFIVLKGKHASRILRLVPDLMTYGDDPVTQPMLLSLLAIVTTVSLPCAASGP